MILALYLIGVMVGGVAGTIVLMKSDLTDYDDREDWVHAVVAAGLVGFFWPVTLWLLIIYLLSRFVARHLKPGGL